MLWIAAVILALAVFWRPARVLLLGALGLFLIYAATGATPANIAAFIGKSMIRGAEITLLVASATVGILALYGFAAGKGWLFRIDGSPEQTTPEMRRFLAFVAAYVFAAAMLNSDLPQGHLVACLVGFALAVTSVIEIRAAHGGGYRIGFRQIRNLTGVALGASACLVVVAIAGTYLRYEAPPPPLQLSPSYQHSPASDLTPHNRQTLDLAPFGCKTGDRALCNEQKKDQQRILDWHLEQRR